MTSIRRLLGLVATIALVGFAAHAEATKIFTLNMTPNALPGLTAGGVGQAVTATFANVTTDSGNSNASSLKLFAPTGITIKTPASSNGASVNIGNGYTAVITNNGTSIFLSNIQLPLKPFAAQPVTLTMTVDVTCTAQSGWSAQMWTGSGWTGQTFLFTQDDGKGNTSSVNTPVSGICGSIAFVAGSQPADAFTNSSITTAPYNSAGAKVQVVVKANNVPMSGVTPTVSSSCASVTGSATTSNANGLSTLTLSSGATAVNNPPGCTITASASGGYGSTGPSNAFKIVAPLGILGCTTGNNTDGTNPAYDPDGDGPFMGEPGWFLRRYDNKTPVPGSDPPNYCPYQIPYTFTFDENGASAFLADKLGQDIIVEYVLVLKNRPTTLGWPDVVRPYFAFGIVNPVFPGDYHLGQACNNDDPANAKNFSPLPGSELMCAAQLGWTGVGPGLVQWWIKIIDNDGFTKMP